MENTSLPEKLLKPYNPADEESRIYKLWEESGYFNPEKMIAEGFTAPDAAPYTIVMPPPNANGDLHAGHALFVAAQDILTRFHRMRGAKALWIPGADHAGFETQVVYEKVLEKEGRSRFDLAPTELYKEILDFTLKNKSTMENQVRALGASCDWAGEKFTLDPDVITKVQATFIKMYDDGLIYRGARTINWCPKHQTSLSDIETDAVEENTPFYTFQYGPFQIGTVRPETKFGDKYVVMHPDDPRYAQYTHGQTIDLEWINGPITATIIKDEVVDMEFGTGAMTITPWHSQVDFEIAKRHNLDMEQIIDWRGKLLPIAGEFAGMKITEARPKIAEKLKEKGLLVSIDTEYKNVVKKCYKCQSMIEPQVKDQWFVKMAPLAKQALDAVDTKKVSFIPDYEEKVFRHWMENTLDWNISRQIVWGIPIPAWFRDGEVAVGMSSPGEGWMQDPDTFDTWFSSGQWPILTTQYPDGKYRDYYPTSVMETGRDLIFFWVARMIIFGLYLTGKVPFSQVYFHGLVNDAKGKKMSKSKGNVINPLTLTDKYGADALRMGLIVGNAPGTDLSLDENKIKGYKLFANKLWNITRFILSNTEGVDMGVPYTEVDNARYTTWHATLADITKATENYNLHIASESIYHYIWDTLASDILEESKPILSDTDASAKASRAKLLYTLLTESITVLHPFMPFVTETIWQMLPHKDRDILMTAPWPQTN